MTILFNLAVGLSVVGAFFGSTMTALSMLDGARPDEYAEKQFRLMLRTSTHLHGFGVQYFIIPVGFSNITVQENGTTC